MPKKKPKSTPESPTRPLTVEEVIQERPEKQPVGKYRKVLLMLRYAPHVGFVTAVLATFLMIITAYSGSSSFQVGSLRSSLPRIR
jgi:hypothetical protein